MALEVLALKLATKAQNARNQTSSREGLGVNAALGIEASGEDALAASCEAVSASLSEQHQAMSLPVTVSMMTCEKMLFGAVQGRC